MRRGTWRAVAPIAVAAASVLAIGSVGAGPSVAVDGAVHSETIELVGSVDMQGAMSLQFSTTAPFAYVHTREGGGRVKVLEISDPLRPRQKGEVALPSGPYMEDMQLGERPDATFVIVRQDSDLVVVDVTNPNKPRVRGRIAASSHTYECSDPSCRYVFATWSNADHGHFTVFDLEDLAAPQELTTYLSPVGVIHDWYRDDAGVMWALGTNGIAAYDTSTPADLKLLNASDHNGLKSPANPYNDRIQLHGAYRVNARAFPGSVSAPSYADGSVLFVSEEGDNAECTDSFQTWFVPSLSRDFAAPPLGAVALGTITPISSWSLLSEPATVAPDPAFCSVHWFDYHESGFVALPTYASGTRVLDVRDPANLEQVAYHYADETMAIQSYWVPERGPNGRTTGRKTNLIYTTDVGSVANPFLTEPLPGGGVDVFRVDPALLARSSG